MNQNNLSNWRWQMQHRVHSLTDLKKYIHPTDDEMAAIEATKGIFRWNITPYYASLMDKDDPNCPIRLQMVPKMAEMLPDFVGVEDPLEELAHSPVKNLIHNYKDRVAFCVTSECAIYCRYCLRKRMVGDSDFMMNKAELQEAIDYLAQHSEIRDVLLTGGDPLIYSDENIEWLLSKLRAIPHIQIIRLGSRLPVTLPQRLTPALGKMLAKYHPLWLNTHFNHPKELTPEVLAGLENLHQNGIPVGNQTVLLKSVNDEVEILKELFEKLVQFRVRPYYLYQAQVIGGTAHFRTSIEKGLFLMRELQGRTSGYAIPKYVLDTPFGKVPMNESYLKGREEQHVLMNTYQEKLWAEPNPIPADELRFAEMLPQIQIPTGTASIPIGAKTFVPLPDYEQIYQNREEILKNTLNFVIEQLRKMKDPVEDNYGLDNLWEEICAQQQHEQSFLWEDYLDVIRSIIENKLVRMIDLDTEALYYIVFKKDKFYIYDDFEEHFQEPLIHEQDLIEFLLEEILFIASEDCQDKIEDKIEEKYGGPDDIYGFGQLE